MLWTNISAYNIYDRNTKIPSSFYKPALSINEYVIIRKMPILLFMLRKMKKELMKEACHNRIRSKTGRTARSLHTGEGGYRDSPTCPLCEGGPQDMDHLILRCPFTAIEGGYQTVHAAGPEFSAWLASHDVGVWLPAIRHYYY